MFEGLNWRHALKRAAIFTGIWVALVYVMHTINPRLFRLGGSEDFFVLALNAVLFFFLYAVFFAFVERRKNRNQKSSQKSSQEKQPRSGPSENGEEGVTSKYRGQVNPNTSRKKASRRRR